MNEEAFFFPLFYDEQFQTSESRISSSSSVFFHVNAEKVKKTQNLWSALCVQDMLSTKIAVILSSSTLRGFPDVDITKSTATVLQCNISLWVTA